MPFDPRADAARFAGRGRALRGGPTCGHFGYARGKPGVPKTTESIREKPATGIGARGILGAMAVVPITLPHHAYEVRIESGLIGRLGPLVRSLAPHAWAGMIADTSVADGFGGPLRSSLEAAGFSVLSHPVEGGEPGKNLDTVRRAYEALAAARFERRSPLLALGGGVIGDTAGFVAATWLRGVPFIQCPTTLVAMVDASVGGKVGVNLPVGKNLVGSFYQPRLVAIDVDTLRTLPPREMRCGIAECVKHAVIRDASLFDWIAANLDAILAYETQTLIELVQRNVRIKAEVVMADEKESGERAHLNFGHTFAHAIEATQGYGGTYEHGEAVALGMVAATALSVKAGRCARDVLDRLTGLLERTGLPTRAADLESPATLIEAMRLDKKVADGRIRLVLPDGMGRVSVVDDCGDDAIEEAWGVLANA